jgi:prolyl 4-hydroxylase
MICQAASFPPLNERKLALRARLANPKAKAKPSNPHPPVQDGAAMSESEALPPFHQPRTPFDWQRSPARAEVGRVGGEALRAAGGERLPVDKAEIFSHDGFLDAADCAALVDLIDAGCTPSPLHIAHRYEGYRTSQTCTLAAANPTVSRVAAEIADLLSIDAACAEHMQGQVYQPGEYYRMHADFYYIDEAYWPGVDAMGGQRTWTAMIYLDLPAAGGATRFPYLDLEFEPRIGRLLAWNNMDAHGAPNSWTIHQGCTVDAGIKHIITLWYRERPFGTPPA